MKISKYNPQSQNEIEQLFTKTFSDSEGQSEGHLIGQLARDLMTHTKAEDLYCFVATEHENIIGSIFFTRMIFESGINAFILGPVAILTRFQGKGIGKTLINSGLKALSADGVELVITYGDPGFYSQVGFGVVSEKSVPAPLELSHPEGWLAQSLAGDKIDQITGRSYCVKALNNPAYW